MTVRRDVEEWRAVAGAPYDVSSIVKRKKKGKK